jgi:hypothetical protein
MMAKMQQSMMASGHGGGPQGPGGIGGNADNGPADTHSAIGAVRAFLKALKAKDRDALTEATALRSTDPMESTGPNKELFGRILDGSISDAELDDLATKLEGYKVAGENPPKSTGRLIVWADKTDKNGTRHRRDFTVRKEKKGWGVMDISTPMVFKAPPRYNPRQRSRGR